MWIKKLRGYHVQAKTGTVTLSAKPLPPLVELIQTEERAAGRLN